MNETFPNTQVSRSPAPQTPTAPRTTTSTTSKLRDSCHICAVSKVKCPKQKPTCLRCEKRGLTCEYFHSKRPGRKRDSQHSIETSNRTTNVDRPASSNGQGQWTNTVTYGNLSGTNEYLTPLLTPLVSPQPGDVSVSGADCSISSSSSSSDLFLFGLVNSPESGLSSAVTGITNNFEDFFASPIDLSELDSLKTGHNFSKSNEIAKLLIPDETNLMQEIERSHTFPGLHTSSNNQTPSNRRIDLVEPPDSASCCLMKALDLMKQLSSTRISASNLSIGTNNPIIGSDAGQSTNHPTQAVILGNKQAIEEVGNMMACPCADDGYLLTVLSMIVFKILARFAAAVRSQSGTFGGINTNGLSRNADDESRTRFTAQLVLGELHRVQRLVNLLSPKLQAYKARVSDKWGLLGRESPQGDFQISAFSGVEMRATPFSATILDQVEKDLRKAISTLSSEIIHILRQS